jgi:hypothetical protein
MANNIFHLKKIDEFRRAGSGDLIEMLPVPGQHPLFMKKKDLEVLTTSICNHEVCHISGPTGTAKSSLLETIDLVPENFEALCLAMGYRVIPLKVFYIEMVVYETPGELLQRRALKNGTTYDEKSQLVECIEEASGLREKTYPLIWLRELGRVHTPSVQGGLLDLITNGFINLPDKSKIKGMGIAWIADSNYQAESDATHTLVVFDDALKRRFVNNITMDYMSHEQEIQILKEIIKVEPLLAPVVPSDELIDKVVKLGQEIRSQKLEGNLLSVPMPTICGYLAFLRMAGRLPHLTPQELSMYTLLGLCSKEDRRQVTGVLNKVFGLQTVDAEDPSIGINHF